MGKSKDQEIGMVHLLGCRCRCGHEWLPRKLKGRPVECPECKHRHWDKPKEKP